MSFSDISSLLAIGVDAEVLNDEMGTNGAK